MDPTPAILTVAATFLVGFGMIWAINASVEKRRARLPGIMIVVGVACAGYAYFLEPTLPEARLPLAFVEVFALVWR